MRHVPSSIQDVWQSGVATGPTKPTTRITMGPEMVSERVFPGNVFRTALFGQHGQPVELFNIKSFSWDKSSEQDAATFTLVLYNTAAVPADETRPGIGPDAPGFYTWKYHVQPLRQPREQQARPPANPYDNLIVPDRIMRSYQGFGLDATVIPEHDSHLVQTGVWLVDDVDISATTGLITVTGRDLARLLIDQIVLPPIVPASWYPLAFSKYTTVPAVTAQVMTAQNNLLQPYTSSNFPYTGNGPVYGHTLASAFDGDPSSYWMSIGNDRPNADYSFEYVEGVMPASTLEAINVEVVGGPYNIYVSVFANGSWQGADIVPYNRFAPPAAPNGSDIPYVMQTTATGRIQLPQKYSGVTRVRVCFSNLWDSHLGVNQYRAAVSNFSVITDSVPKTVVVSPAKRLGNYGDYTDIIKLFLAWGGFYWPRTSAQQTLTDGSVINVPAPSDDKVLGKGRIWGDLETTGTVGIVPLTVDLFDKKPLMDGIKYIQDMIGFYFGIGDLGGAIWRTPNIFSLGNYVELDGGGGKARVTDMLTIDERQTLLDLDVKLSSANVRERIFVADTTGHFGATVAGFNPEPNGEVRVGGYTDMNFSTNQECLVMADFIALRQLFTYRTDKVHIMANPAIQVDDQVIIKEQVTGENYVHYVQGIHAEHDLESGEFTYELDTYWLGTHPNGVWAFRFQELAAATQLYLSLALKAPVI